MLVAGGYGSGSLASAELYDAGLGYDAAWQPALSSVTSPLLLGNPFTATGSGFRGYGLGEASGGATNSSATNYPLVQLRRLDSEQTRWLPLAAFDATSLATDPLAGFPPGPSLVTVFVNGIPSASKVISVVTPPVTASAGGGDLVLAWPFASDDIPYQVWRGTSPYFAPPGEGEQPAGVSCEQVNNVVTCTDTGAIGDPNPNLYYVVRFAYGSGQFLLSNRTGTFSFPLGPGGTSAAKP